MNLQLSSSHAEARIWMKGGWITLFTLKLDPAKTVEGDAVPYSHDHMAQYFDWDREDPCLQKTNLFFVFIQQTECSWIIESTTGNVFPVVSKHYYHFLVDTQSAKVVKQKIGITDSIVLVIPDEEEEEERHPPPEKKSL